LNIKGDNNVLRISMYKIGVAKIVKRMIACIFLVHFSNKSNFIRRKLVLGNIKYYFELWNNI